MVFFRSNSTGKEKKQMGRLHQGNKELNSAVSTYDNFEKKDGWSIEIKQG